MTRSWLLIEGGNLIDGAGASPVPGVSVLCCDDRIVAVGAGVDDSGVPVAERSRLRRIDAAGKTIMPGMIDGHCHMTYGESRSQEEQDIYTSVEGRTLRAAHNVTKVLRAGFTGLSQPGGSWYIGVALREAIRAGMVQGPRMFSAGRYITTSNGLTDWYPEPTGVPDGSIGLLANTLPEMIDAVRRQVKNGVDLIKLSDSPYGEFQAFADDELKGVVDTAHRLGKRATIHARGNAEVAASVKAGFDWIMHGNVMTEQTIEELAASRIPLVPTLLLLANLSDYAELAGVPRAQSDGARRMLDKTAAVLHRAHEAGVRFVVGTDSGFSVTPYGDWHARELELLMTYAGLSELESIQAATSNAAITIGLDGEAGVVEAGYLADLLVVAGDPSRDIRVLQDKRNIETVVLGGSVVQFDEDRVRRRWPNESAIVYSTRDLTWDLVHHNQTAAEQWNWDEGEGREMAREISRVGALDISEEELD
jgi:imidazolonepropionase-like amidohydrolase